MLGLLTMGLSRKALSLTLAAVMLATTLAVAPIPEWVPVVGDGNRAQAHDAQTCWTEYHTVWIQDSDGRHYPHSYPVRTCRSVAHTHPPPPNYPIWLQAGLTFGCAAVSAAGFLAGLACVTVTAPITLQ